MAQTTASNSPLTELSVSNVMLTPHTAGHGEGSMADNRQQSVDQVLRFLAGRWPTSLVNPEVKGRARAGDLKAD